MVDMNFDVFSVILVFLSCFFFHNRNDKHNQTVCMKGYGG